MKRTVPIVVLLGFAALSFFLLALPLDRGPFQGGTQTMEWRFWESAKAIHKSGLGALKSDTTTSPLYSLLLSPLATSELGAVSAARRALMLITLPILAFLVTALGWRSRGVWPGVAAGMTVLCTAPVLLDAGTFTPAVPAALFALLILLLVSFRTILSWIAAGALLAVIVRLVPLLGASLAFTILVGLALRRDGSRSRRLAACVGTLIVVTLALEATGRMGSVLTATTGIDMYRGHRAPASGVVPRRGDRDERFWWGPGDYLREASRLENRGLSPAATARFWAARAVVESVTHPLQELRRSGVKLLAAFQADPAPRGVSAAFLEDRAENAWPLRASTGIARVLLPLGLLGLLAGTWSAIKEGGGHRARTTLLLASGAISGWLSASITFAEADVRLLSVLCLCGGMAPLVAALRHAPRSRWPHWAGGSLAMILLFGFAPRWGAVPGLGILGADALEVGALYDREGRGSAAMREYERALRLDPRDPYPRFAIAGLLARDNVIDQAIGELEHLRENHPDFLPAITSLATLFQKEEKWVEAAAMYGVLAEREPWNAEHFNNLGTMYVQVGYYDQATRALEAALALDPSYKVARDNLEELRSRGLAPGAPEGADSLRVSQEKILDHMRAGRMDAARAELDSAYARFGREHFELHFLDGTLHLLSGDPAGAIPLLESTARNMPENVPVLANLGTAYAQAGRLEDAERTLLTALRLQPANLQIQQSLKGVEAALDSLKRSGR